MHLCRGNFRSSWIAQGGYEPVAELLFNQIGVDGYFMEFDTERAGGFDPLRFVPKGKTVVLGLVTSKTGALESVDYLERRIDEAAQISSISSSFASARSAGSPAPRKATRLPKTSSGRSWRASSKSPRECGELERSNRDRHAAGSRPLDTATRSC